MHPVKHFKTITRHRHLVCRYCFRLGLWRQGLTHDLSKYSLTEFLLDFSKCRKRMIIFSFQSKNKPIGKITTRLAFTRYDLIC